MKPKFRMYRRGRMYYVEDILAVEIKTTAPVADSVFTRDLSEH